MCNNFFIEDTIFLITIIGLFSDGREWVFAEGPRDATARWLAGSGLPVLLMSSLLMSSLFSCTGTQR